MEDGIEKTVVIDQRKGAKSTLPLYKTYDLTNSLIAYQCTLPVMDRHDLRQTHVVLIGAFLARIIPDSSSRNR